ncbi:AraC family transcriptional regulator [Paenibacillus sp. PAMC21692]|uniref:AraC family transcriptional regulator n=1 Tax=Paenibacillus sp. PAMC21692 TaxID=2762320 RepID=UPI00164D4D7D|nr:helix-turn-helix domain-containing protein [Paenibacillus sp. PAMC21692]QNK56996.1 AraC family transcriptional regulator [Paenibacillus sp. PAMC21692]
MANKLSRLLGNTTFKHKLFLYSLLLCIVPVLILGTVSSTIASRMVQEEVDHNHQIILRQIQFQVDRFLQTLEKASIDLANNRIIENSVKVGPSMQHLDASLDMIDLLQRQRNFSEVSYDISIIYSNFGKIYSNRDGLIEQEDFVYADIARQINAKFTAPFVISPSTYPNQDELLVIRSVPLFTTGKADGYVMLHVQSNKLSSFVQSVQLGDRRRLLVMDDRGTVVASHNPAEIGTRINSAELYRYWSNPAESTNEIDLDGVPYQVSMERSAFNNWTYLALTESSLLTGKAERIETLTWLIVAALAAIWVSIALFGTNRLYNPIQRLTNKFSGENRDRNSQVPRDGLKALDSFIHHVVMTNDRLQHRLDEQLPYLKETVYQQLLRGEMTVREIREKTEHYGFPLKGNWFRVCLVDVDEFGRFRETYHEKDRSLLFYALRKMCEELCEQEPDFSCITAAPLPGQVAIVIGMDRIDGDSERKVEEMVAQINGTVREYFQFTVTVALSRSGKGYLSISESYQQSLELLSYRLLLGHNQFITSEELEPSVEQSRTTIIKRQKKIISSITRGDLEGAGAELEEMMQEVPQYVQNSETVLGLFAYLIGQLDVLLQDIGLDPKTFFPVDPYKELYAKTSLNEVTDWLKGSVFPAVARHMGSLRSSKQKTNIQLALDYIHNRYDTDLSLQHVAEQLGISPSQLSRSFKEETDIHFGDYLIQYRMDKAKEFLVHTDMPIKEISEKLCYTSVQNFTRIFKQMVQIPPGQYRKQFRDGEFD